MPGNSSGMLPAGRLIIKWGLELRTLKFVPLQPSGTKDHPQYLSERSVVDSHIHEKAVLPFQKMTVTLRPARKCLLISCEPTLALCRVLQYWPRKP